MLRELTYNRLIRRVSQRELARLTGLSQSRISRIEREEFPATREELRLIALALREIPTVLEDTRSISAESISYEPARAKSNSADSNSASSIGTQEDPGEIDLEREEQEYLDGSDMDRQEVLEWYHGLTRPAETGNDLEDHA